MTINPLKLETALRSAKKESVHQDLPKPLFTFDFGQGILYLIEYVLPFLADGRAMRFCDVDMDAFTVEDFVVLDDFYDLYQRGQKEQQLNVLYLQFYYCESCPSQSDYV